jgi:hypothetical protein
MESLLRSVGALTEGKVEDGISVFLKKKQKISSSELCLLFNGPHFSYLQQHFSLYLRKGEKSVQTPLLFLLNCRKNLMHSLYLHQDQYNKELT